VVSKVAFTFVFNVCRYDEVEAFIDSLWWEGVLVKAAGISDHVLVAFPDTHPRRRRAKSGCRPTFVPGRPPRRS
jgi:hypothetical protein